MMVQDYAWLFRKVVQGIAKAKCAIFIWLGGVMWVLIRGKQWEWAGMIPHEACDSRGGLLICYG